MRIFPADTLQLLEFDKVLSEVAKYCDSRPGLDRVEKVRPLDRFEEVQKMLKQTKEMSQVLIVEDKFPHDKIYDIRETVKLLAIENFVLSEDQLSELKKTALLAGAIVRFFQNKQEVYQTLSAFTRHIVYEKNIAAEISKVIDDDGKMRPNASPELMQIRKEIDTLTRRLEKEFQAALSKYRKAGYLSDVEESMRNGRRVLGIQSEYKRQLKGIIHDESDTGKTVFIEPEDVVNIQNDIFELEREEKREIYKILKTLTQIIAPYKDHLDSYQHLLSIIDFTRAKAKYALAINADLPSLEKSPKIYLHHARHPILYLLNKKINKQVVPLDVEIDENNRLLIISGPNAGGKSVAMKTIGLLQVMLQSGLLIPAADQSRVGIFNNIFCDIGDTQSLEDELSTYSSRLMKMKHFIKFGDKQTLILIDEFGTGTDPAMGGAIAEASLNQLNQQKVFGVITTHYANLKSYASNHIGVFNGSMLFDESALKPMYILETGKPGSSYAFEIAKKSDLPQHVIEDAMKLISKEHLRFEELLKNVRIEKEHIKLRDKEVSKKEEDIKKKEEELKQALIKAKEKEERYNLKKLEKEDDAIRQMEKEFRNMLEELKSVSKTETAQGNEQQKQVIREFISAKRKTTFKERKTLAVNTIPQYQKGEIKIGGLVKLIAGTEVGRLESVHKNKATVVFKNLKTTIPLEELMGIAETEAPQIQQPVLKVEIDKSDFNSELDLRGKSKEEALVELENYLDKAMMRNIFQVRILHGKGTGAIRELVQQTLKKNKGIKKFEFATREQGGDGVTLVEF